ncbi:MAG TPA: glycoside hydrolase family 15 protein [Candidatus Dormibacteraeota bacterium]|nr:glycoside hydrolase family 15 protein [Candidatus Dormibacteraeota bacterium]
MSPFPPIADYAFLSDCEVTALIAPSGNVEWMCLPRMDSPSIFGSILDRAAGGFRLGPADIKVPASRRYLPGTMVLETSWEANGGWVIIRDVLLIGHWHHDMDLSQTFRRSPTDYDAEHVLLRTVRCVQGEVQLVMDCKPVFNYGVERANWSYTDRGYHQGLATADGIELELKLTSDMRIGFEGPRATARTLLKAGETRFCALSWTKHEPPLTYDEAYDRLVWTAHHWQHWLARGNFPDHRWRSYLQRSALTLKGLTYANTGAVVAAPTTSLPETPGGERNWDYRYSWIRDSSLTLWGLYNLGFDWEANDYFYFIADIAERDQDLQIVYGVDGENDLAETTLEHLSGYDGARPVRIGNGAYKQRQNDVWGSVIEAVYLHATSRDHLDERLWPILKRQVEQALKHWREPDCGMWEVRGEPKHFTSSKLMCWVAADRGARLARLREEAAEAERWQAGADEIHADICLNGVDDRGVFTAHYETEALDASLLLMPLFGFLPPTDPRIRATVLAIRRELSADGLIQRYRVSETDDGLTGEEGSFAICSFWMVSALSAIGEHRMARLLCEKLLSYASPLELYAEEVDGKSGRHLGNFPQAFTHLALINAVMHVIQAEEEVKTKDRPAEGRLSL